VFFQHIEAGISGEQPRLILNCALTLRCDTPCAPFFVAVDICDQSFTPIMQALPESAPFIEGIPGDHQLNLEIELPPLVPGIYRTGFWIGSHFTNTLDYLRNELAFEITKSPSLGRSFPHSPECGWAVPITRFSYSLQASKALVAQEQ
jgi:hypothetical protein